MLDLRSSTAGRRRPQIDTGVTSGADRSEWDPISIDDEGRVDSCDDAGSARSSKAPAVRRPAQAAERTEIDALGQERLARRRARLVATAMADPDISSVIETPFDAALSERYLVYALSTITARSLPDVRDGLKPVHRRLLWAMRLLRLDPAGALQEIARASSAT